MKEFSNQTLAAQVKKGEQLVSMMAAIKKAFNLMGHDIVDLSTENDALKNGIGSYDQQGSKNSKTKLPKQFDDERRTNLFKSRMKKQMNKH